MTVAPRGFPICVLSISIDDHHEEMIHHLHMELHHELHLRSNLKPYIVKRLPTGRFELNYSETIIALNTELTEMKLFVIIA